MAEKNPIRLIHVSFVENTFYKSFGESQVIFLITNLKLVLKQIGTLMKEIKQCFLCKRCCWYVIDTNYIDALKLSELKCILAEWVYILLTLCILPF